MTTTLSRKQLLELAHTYFAGEKLDVSCGSQVNLEEAYQSLRAAISGKQHSTAPLDQLRFTSEPQDGELDMSKLKYK